MAVLLIVCAPLKIKFLNELLAVKVYVGVPPVSSKLKLAVKFSLTAPVVIVLVTAEPPPIHSINGVPA